MIVLLLSTFFAIIVGIDGQYGQPMVGGNNRFDYHCQQTESDVIAYANLRQFEVEAGKSFTYTCDFFVDTRVCDHNPQESGCEGIEIVWSMPDKLTRAEKKKGIKRKTEDAVISNEQGYTKYTTTLRLIDVGAIHSGDYVWEFNFRFEMRTVFRDSFTVTAIDLLQVDEPCKYDDSCQSNQCLEGLCVGKANKAVPWIVVGSLLAVLLIVLVIIGSIIFYVNRKHQRYINRRF